VPVEEFHVGDRVIHDAHGLGRVVDVEGPDALLVDFGTVRERFVSPYPKLGKL
jgi:transcription elongation factor GreA-like protein